MRKRKRVSADQRLLKSNIENDVLQSTRVRQKENDLTIQEIEMQRLQKYVEKLEKEIETNEIDDSNIDDDENYDFNQDNGNEYNIEDQKRLEFLETMTIRGGAIKLVSVSTLRLVEFNIFFFKTPIFLSRIAYDLLIRSLISARQIPNIFQSIQDGTNICRNPDVCGSQFYTRLRYSFAFLNEMHILEKIRKADTIMIAFGKNFDIF